jgi:hypothetical protein
VVLLATVLAGKVMERPPQAHKIRTLPRALLRLERASRALSSVVLVGHVELSPQILEPLKFLRNSWSERLTRRKGPRKEKLPPRKKIGKMLQRVERGVRIASLSAPKREMLLRILYGIQREMSEYRREPLEQGA